MECRKRLSALSLCWAPQSTLCSSVGSSVAWAANPKSMIFTPSRPGRETVDVS